MASSIHIRKVLAAVDSISKKHPVMALLFKLSLSCLLCIVVVNLLDYSVPSQAHFKQVTSPPNELPPLFPDNSSIVDLCDGDIFQLNTVINENVATLVFFYARWCTHCKLVARTFEKVAETLKGKVAVVAIDCWYVQGMCRRSVQGTAFPVVYGHTAGQQILYSQGLREDELMKFAARLLRPLHRVTSVEQLELDLETNEVMFIGNFDFSTAYHPKGFLEYHLASVMALHDDPLNAPPFAVVSDARVAKGLSLPTAPGIVVVSYLGGMRQYQGAYDKEALYNWTVDNRMAQVLVQNLSPNSGRVHQILHNPAALLFLPLNQSAAALRELHRAARLQLRHASSAPQPCPSLRHLKHLHCSYPHLPHTLLRCPVTDRGQAQNAPDDGYSTQQKPFAPFLSEDPFSCLSSEILKAAPFVASSWFNPTEHFFLNPLTPCFPLKLSFFYVDSVRYVPVLHSIGYRVASKHTTALVVVDVKSELQFLKDFGNSSVEANAIVDFISDVTLGKVPPLLKSAPSPENPCLRSGSLNSACIWELTAETFTQAVMNTNEDVLLVHYAPWCAACTGLWSVLFAVGEAVRPSTHLIIARIDAEANDVLPCHKASVYPTLTLYPAYRKSNPIVYQTSGPYFATNIVHFLQQHSTHPILTVSDADSGKEDISLADWSHEGWLLWIQAQNRILNLEKKNERLYHKVKELEYQLVNRGEPQEDYVALAKEQIDKVYAQLQNLVMQQFSMLAPSGRVPPPPPPVAEEEGDTTFADFMSGNAFTAKDQQLGSHPDRKVCHSEECRQKEVGRQLKEGRQPKEGRQLEEGRQLKDDRQPEEGRQLEEGRQFDGDIKDGLRKSGLPHKRVVIADDAGIVFDVPARKAEEDAEEAPDSGTEEESEPVHHATRMMADDAGLVIQRRDRDGSAGNSGSMPKAVGEDPTNDAVQFEDATDHDGKIPLDTLAGRHDHEEYPLPLQEAPAEEADTHTSQAAHEALSSTADSNPQDTPDSLTGDESFSDLDPGQADSSNSLDNGQMHRMGDLG